MSQDPYIGAGHLFGYGSLYPDAGAASLEEGAALQQGQGRENARNLAVILTGARGELVRALAGGEAADLRGAVARLDGSGRAGLQAAAGNLSAWFSLSEEKNSGQFYSGVYQLGLAAERRGSSALANRAYEFLLGREGVPAEVVTQVKERVALSRGEGPLVLQGMEGIRNLKHTVFTPGMVAGFALGTTGFQLGRWGIARLLAGGGELGWGGCVAANVGGVGVELAGFTVGDKGVNTLLGHEVDWSAQALSAEMVHMAYLVGPMRVMGGVSKAALGLRNGAAGAVERFAAEQLGVVSGISVGQGLQIAVGEMDYHGMGSFAVSGLTTYANVGAGGLFAKVALGNRLTAFNRRMELGTQDLLRQTGAAASGLADAVGSRLFGNVRVEVPVDANGVAFLPRGSWRDALGNNVFAKASKSIPPSPDPSAADQASQVGLRDSARTGSGPRPTQKAMQAFVEAPTEPPPAPKPNKTLVGLAAVSPPGEVPIVERSAPPVRGRQTLRPPRGEAPPPPEGAKTPANTPVRSAPVRGAAQRPETAASRAATPAAVEAVQAPSSRLTFESLDPLKQTLVMQSGAGWELLRESVRLGPRLVCAIDSSRPRDLNLTLLRQLFVRNSFLTAQKRTVVIEFNDGHSIEISSGRSSNLEMREVKPRPPAASAPNGHQPAPVVRHPLRSGVRGSSRGGYSLAGGQLAGRRSEVVKQPAPPTAVPAPQATNGHTYTTMEALFQCVDQVRIGRGETVTLLLDGPSLGTSELGLFMHRLAKRSSDLRGGTLQIYDRTAGKVYPFAIDVGVERMPPMAVKRT